MRQKSEGSKFIVIARLKQSCGCSKQISKPTNLCRRRPSLGDSAPTLSPRGPVQLRLQQAVWVSLTLFPVNFVFVEVVIVKFCKKRSVLHYLGATAAVLWNALQNNLCLWLWPKMQVCSTIIDVTIGLFLKIKLKKNMSIKMMSNNKRWPTFHNPIHHFYGQRQSLEHISQRRHECWTVTKKWNS